MRRSSEELLMRQYFLGDLPREQRDRLENLYLADGEIFEELLSTENDLIDAYVRGELTEDENRKFEAEYFTSQERRERIEFARALDRVSALARQSAQFHSMTPWKRVWAALSVQQAIPRWVLVVTVLAMIVSGSWLTLENLSLKAGLRQASAEQAELRRQEDDLRQQIAKFEGNPTGQVHEGQGGSETSKLETPMGPVLTLRLNPGTARSTGEHQETLVIPSTTPGVELQLKIDRDEYKIYKAVLTNVDGQEILQSKALHSQSINGTVSVDWSLPASSLLSGDYIVELRGQPPTGPTEDVEAYSFRILRR